MSWKIDLSAWTELEKQLEIEAAKGAANCAKTIQSAARAKAPSPSNPGPYATGATEAGIYVSTPTESDYGECAANAQRLNPRAKILDETKPDDLGAGRSQCVIGVLTGHAEFIEKEHFSDESGAYVAARPFLEPALNEAEAQLERDLLDAMKRAGFK